MTDVTITRISFKVTNSFTHALSVTVEPWAHEFSLPPGSCLELRIEDGDRKESIELKMGDARATIWINTGNVASATIDETEVWP